MTPCPSNTIFGIFFLLKSNYAFPALSTKKTGSVFSRSFLLHTRRRSHLSLGFKVLVGFMPQRVVVMLLSTLAFGFFT